MNSKNNAIVNVPVENIIFNHYQVDGTISRATVDEIKASLIQNKDNGSKGLLQITRGRKLDDGRYEQAFGRHRLIAFQELAQVEEYLGFWDEMPLLVSELTDLEMFELMGIENFSRRDISPVEEASIFHTYMTDFHKTSVEAAVKFGKTEEYVRQAVRVLNLPESAQRMLETGELNKSAARDLLVVNKVGGLMLVNDATELILARPAENASELIEQVLQETDEVETLNPSADWFSANKKFPHKHLKPVDTKLVGEIIETAEGYAAEDVGHLREIARLVAAGMEVSAEAFPQVTPESLERLRVIANPVPCEKCPLHAVLNGNHYCGIPLCKERKQAAWKAKGLEDQVNAIGVPMYQKSDGPFVKLSPYDATDKKLWEARGADLRIMPSNYEWNNFDGLGMDLKAVIVGAVAEKRLKKVETEKSKREKEEITRQNHMRAHHMKGEFADRFTWEVASPAFATALDGIHNTTLLGILCDRNSYTLNLPKDVDEDELISEAKDIKKASERAAALRRIVMGGMIGRRLSDDDFELDVDEKKLVVKHSQNLQKLAKEWDVKLPSDFAKQAEKYQAELEAALKAIEEGKADHE